MGHALKQTTKKLPHLWVIVVGVLLMAVHAFYRYTQSTSRSVILLALLGILLVIGAYALYLRLRNRDRKERLFLTSLIALGLCFTFVFPPGTVPDEVHHFEASYAYSNGTPGLTDRELEMRVDDAEFVESLDTIVRLSNYEQTANELAFFADDTSSTTIAAVANFGMSGNPPQVKFASALGITLGKALGLSSLFTFYLGRLFNLALFIVLAYWAVRLTPIGKNIFIVISLLPMTLHVVASYSYDAGILGYSFIFAALCLKAIYEKKIQPPIIFILIIAFGLLLTPCKSIYSLLLLLILFIPKRAFAHPSLAKWFKAGLLIGGLLAIYCLTFTSISSVAASSAATDYLDHRGEAEGHFYGLSDLIAHPLHTLTILFNTFEGMSWFYIHSLVGSNLGWFQAGINAPGFFTLVLVVVLLLSLLNHPKDTFIPKPLMRVSFLAIFAIVTLGAVVSMLLGHTFNFEEVAMGVQGRYFLPALPLALLALRTCYLQFSADPKNWLTIFLVWFNALYLLRIFAISLTIA